MEEKPVKKGILKVESQAKNEGTLKWDEKAIELVFSFIIPAK